MKAKHSAEEGKVRLLLPKPGCHNGVTLVGSCYKVPSERSMSKQEMDISKGDLFLPPKTLFSAASPSFPALAMGGPFQWISASFPKSEMSIRPRLLSATITQFV